MESPSLSISPKLAGLRVLIVDDNQPMRKLIRGIIESLGIRQITDTDNCELAIKKMEAEGFDIAMIDWKMEPMNGIEMIKRIRGNKESIYWKRNQV